MKLLEVESEDTLTQSKETKENLDSTMKAVFWKNVYAISGASCNATFKSINLNYGFSVFDLFVLRPITLTLMSLIYLVTAGINPLEFPTDKPKQHYIKLLTIRSVVGHSGFLSFMFGLHYTPVALCTIFLNMNPFMISVAAYLINGEPIRKFEIVGMVICVIGMIFLSKSTFDS